MSLLLNLAASAGMLLFLLFLAWRGLAELHWLPAALAERSPARPRPLEMHSEKMPARTAIFWAAAALAIQWLALWLGWLRAAPGAAFSVWLQQRMTQAGDAPHYLYLAQYGYASSGEMVNRIVFYPLYPLAVRAAAALVGSYPLAGLLVSQGCWAGAAAVMRRLAGKVFPDREQAVTAVLGMLLFPFSFFSQGVFTESLYLLLTLSALAALAERRWRAAGVLGFLSGLCRMQGLVLVIPGIFLWLAARLEIPKKDRKKAVWLLGPAGGFGVYLLLNRIFCGSFFAFGYYESIAPWYQSVQWIGKTVAQQWEMAGTYPGLAVFIYGPQLILYFLSLALLFQGLWGGAPMAFLLYGGAYLGMCYLQGWMISGGRYLFGCGAFYLLIAGMRSRRVRGALLLAEGVGLLWYAYFFVQGQSIM
jgi:hypothetical protein